MNIKHVQRVISLTSGDAQKEVTISEIFGNIIGYATKLIGNYPAGETADIEIKNGGNSVLMPIDQAISEISGKNSFDGMVCPLNVTNPGQVQALIRPSSVLTGGQSYRVKVIIFYDADSSRY